jgi:hypothetical protein
MEFRRVRESESQRQYLINRLKKTKNPQEREKILWALEGLKKDADDAVHELKRPPITSEPTREAQRIPIELPKGLNLLIRLAVPVFFVFIGFSFVLKGITKGLEGGDFAPEVGQFITGAIFIVMGLVGLRKAGNLKVTPEDTRKDNRDSSGMPDV